MNCSFGNMVCSNSSALCTLSYLPCNNIFLCDKSASVKEVFHKVCKADSIASGVSATTQACSKPLPSTMARFTKQKRPANKEFNNFNFNPVG